MQGTKQARFDGSLIGPTAEFDDAGDGGPTCAGEAMREGKASQCTCKRLAAQKV